MLSVFGNSINRELQEYFFDTIFSYASNPVLHTSVLKNWHIGCIYITGKKRRRLKQYHWVTRLDGQVIMLLQTMEYAIRHCPPSCVPKLFDCINIVRDEDWDYTLVVNTHL